MVALMLSDKCVINVRAIVVPVRLAPAFFIMTVIIFIAIWTVTFIFERGMGYTTFFVSIFCSFRSLLVLLYQINFTVRRHRHYFISSFTCIVSTVSCTFFLGLRSTIPGILYVLVSLLSSTMPVWRYVLRWSNFQAQPLTYMHPPARLIWR